jgi:acylphosphatase
MAIVRAHVIFGGRVQGVFFRAFTEEVARSHALTGWVRNLRDGSVEATFEGERAAVETAIEECREGPPAAVVSETRIDWGEPTGEFTGFSVKFY